MPIYFILTNGCIRGFGSEEIYHIGVDPEVEISQLRRGEFVRLEWSLYRVISVDGNEAVLARSKRSKGRWARATRIGR
jgi:hypothetical protein